MTTLLETILERLNEVAKEKLESEVVCPSCSDRHCFIKHGHYRRYLFTGNDMVKIQRYRCRNPDCPRYTFSCLPHPFLPVIRLSLCALMTILTMIEHENATAAPRPFDIYVDGELIGNYDAANHGVCEIINVPADKGKHYVQLVEQDNAPGKFIPVSVEIYDENGNTYTVSGRTGGNGDRVFNIQ